jgi:hypothetical protein
MSVDVVASWTGRRADALREALRMTNETFADHLGVAVRTVANWRSRPDMTPSPTLQEVLDAALAKAPEQVTAQFRMLLAADYTPVREATAGIPILGMSATPQPTTMSFQPEEIFTAAAYESANDTYLRSTRLGSEVIAQLQENVVRVARRYAGQPPLGVFAEARRTREMACRLAEQTRRPADLADLYVVAGEAGALMASIAFDLGHWEAAATIAQSATTYADLAGHSHLEAWTLGLQGTLAFWREDLEQAAGLLDRGLATAPDAAQRFRIRYILSRVHALRGDAAAVGEVLRLAEGDRDAASGGRDPLLDEVQGEFAFDDARAAACAGAAWLQLGRGEEAERYTQTALERYLAVPVESRPFSPLNGVRIDTAAARLLQGELDGAAQALRPVFDLTPSRRNAALTGRLTHVRRLLRAPRWAKDAHVSQLADELTNWMSDTAASPLPGGPVS